MAAIAAADPIHEIPGQKNTDPAEPETDSFWQAVNEALAAADPVRELPHKDSIGESAEQHPVEHEPERPPETAEPSAEMPKAQRKPGPKPKDPSAPIKHQKRDKPKPRTTQPKPAQPKKIHDSADRPPKTRDWRREREDYLASTHTKRIDWVGVEDRPINPASIDLSKHPNLSLALWNFLTDEQVKRPPRQPISRDSLRYTLTLFHGTDEKQRASDWQKRILIAQQSYIDQKRPGQTRRAS
jgi:hypothetical protein